jgi:hypothetical protein
MTELPLWAIYALTVIFTLVAIEFGHWLGKSWQRRHPGEKESSVGALAGATMGLLAFLLAFTTGMAVTRFDTRRQLVVSEANAIGTTNLRAGYLEEPHRQEIRDLLRTYVDDRLAAVETRDIDRLVEQSEAIHAALWAHAESLAIAHPTSPMVALFIASLNETIDLHTVRYTAATNARLPTPFWIALYTVTFLTMLLVGMQASYGPRQNLLALLLLALIFGAVILLITDLSLSQEGVLNVSQQAMIDLQQQLHEMAP